MRPMIGLLAGLLSSMALAQSPPLTLQDAMRNSAERLPSVQAAQAVLESAQAYARLIGSQPNPYVRLSATAGDTIEEANSLVIPFEISGQPRLRRESAEQEALARTRDLATQKRLVALRTGQAYYTLWEKQETLRAARARTSLAEQLAFSTLRRYQVGEIAHNTHLRAELELARAQSEQVTAQSEFDLAAGVLNLLLGRDPATPITIEDQAGEIPSLAVPPEFSPTIEVTPLAPSTSVPGQTSATVPATNIATATSGSGATVSSSSASNSSSATDSPQLTNSTLPGSTASAATNSSSVPAPPTAASQLQAVEQGATQLPEVEALRYEAQALQGQTELARRGRSPTLQLSFYRDRFVNVTTQGIQLALTIPIWDWGQVEAEVQRREGLARAAQARVAERELAVRQRAVEAFRRYQGAQARKLILRQQVVRFAKLAGDARRAYNANLMTLLEVFDTQQAYRAALQTYITAEAEAARAALELGALSPSGFFEEVTRVP